MGDEETKKASKSIFLESLAVRESRETWKGMVGTWSQEKVLKLFLEIDDIMSY